MSYKEGIFYSKKGEILEQVVQRGSLETLKVKLNRAQRELI